MRGAGTPLAGESFVLVTESGSGVSRVEVQHMPMLQVAPGMGLFLPRVWCAHPRFTQYKAPQLYACHL